MGLIKAVLGAAGGFLADQWREYFYCEALDANTLVTKGVHRTGKRSSNTKGSDNVISNGSIVAVNEGQCMIIVDQGKITEFCAEAGEFLYDSSSEPSLFYGKLGKNLIESFKAVGKRIAFGGEPPKDQRVYYFNTKEITDNKFGTQNPVPFKVVINEQLGFKLSVDLRCHGVYSYKIVDPLLFYTNVCGNVAESYDRSNIDAMLKGELIMALQPALATLSAAGVSYDQIPAHTKEVRDALNVELKDEWGKRGIEVFSMNMGVPSIPEEQRKKITEWEETSMTLNPNTAAARMVGGQISAMNTAAGNEGGAMTGFLGMGMAMNAGGANAATLYTMGQQNPQAPVQPAPAQPAPAGWTCACGAAGNTGKFCSECGAAKPQDAAGWTCACGAVNKGKFCSECGARKPADAPLYKCDKCGWEPEDPKNPPKFCPECGDRFDDKDVQ
ncbi:MAG: SPFH domain-containing protein [Clostridia bacterium]|jgi:membrane protease subunit (stomatin/prohibitin family)|nr:SPFH domain-containing protein [Clostridia bacterium]MBO7549454.1 SPFH domain-containing protein [Clostridia bacterium]MBO7665813.1 SPFH domain-containing protein [Clostridia bacterium]MBP5238401.1 SPFH domain-containing protein [Clostridia bacterium]